ncbi:hypothetical protein PG997_004927 [Apiospora hydei]|uniref:C2H2-type domain-containing protein n=1 Tax=Apiospora hydei TaxID=1337664 RepID=A0ABR1X3J1_9PEZI
MDGNERLTWNSGVTGTDGLSPLSSGVHSGSSQSSQAGGIPPYNNNHPQGNWALTQNSSYTYSTLGQSQPGLMQSSYSARQQLYSPPGNAYGNRSSQSPATGDGLVAPPYDNVGPTFPSAVAGGGVRPLLDAFAVFTSYTDAELHSQLPNHCPQAPAPAATATTDTYSRSSTTSGYYAPPSSTPHQPSYPSYSNSHHSPTQSSPTTTGAIPRGIPALSSHHSMHAPTHYSGRHYGGYSALAPPPMSGAVLSNMGTPNAPAILVGGMNPMAHGYPPHMGHHHMYSHGQPPHQERPFKCDVCPQSFNRNHDLKRHKRIHLAVKPFPCEHCDKSFSRKDALKRHTLVKGCGTGKSSPTENSSPHREMKPDPDGQDRKNI